MMTAKNGAFEPVEAGFYYVYIRSVDRHNYPFDDRERLEREETSSVRIIEVLEVGAEFRFFDRGQLVTTEQIGVAKWKGPVEHVRRCFKCTHPMIDIFFSDKDIEERYDPRIMGSPINGVSFSTTGNYGSSVMDDMGRSEIHITVCDVCLIRYSDSVLHYDVIHDLSKEGSWKRQYENARPLSEELSFSKEQRAERQAELKAEGKIWNTTNGASSWQSPKDRERSARIKKMTPQERQAFYAQEKAALDAKMQEVFGKEEARSDFNKMQRDWHKREVLEKKARIEAEKRGKDRK